MLKNKKEERMGNMMEEKEVEQPLQPIIKSSTAGRQNESYKIINKHLHLTSPASNAQLSNSSSSTSLSSSTSSSSSSSIEA
jgi:hypothetical protein